MLGIALTCAGRVAFVALVLTGFSLFAVWHPPNWADQVKETSRSTATATRESSRVLQFAANTPAGNVVEVHIVPASNGKSYPLKGLAWVLLAIIAGRLIFLSGPRLGSKTGKRGASLAVTPIK